MGGVEVISTSTIHAPSQNDNETSHEMIDLTPWDLQFLPFGVNQKGLLYHHHHPIDTNNQIQHLKHSLISTLSFFPPFAGRLVIKKHKDNTISCSIACNNAGALFVHARAVNTCVADILEPIYLPPILYSFFPLNGTRNYQGTSNPLLAVQVTELVDGIFIGCTINHVVVDGKSIWHFINSWAQISKGGSNCLRISKQPSFQRWFPSHIKRPIQFPFTMEGESINDDEKENLNPPERLFHFSKEKIAELKLKANLEAGAKKVSSLQALFTHLWRSVIRSKKLDAQEEVHYVVVIGVRPRLVPPLPEDYFGNAMIVCGVTMKAGELLLEGGLGKGALEMNKMIALHSKDDMLRNHYECWLRTPSFMRLASVANSNSLVTSSSPWFDVYGNDFGWGKPVGVRSGGANKRNGKISVFAGAEEGSMDLEVCLPYEILEAIGNDPEFMDAVSK